jgi:hypothetical protein
VPERKELDEMKRDERKREREKERVSENVAWLCWIVYKNTSRALYNIVKKPRFSPRCSSRLNF